MSFKSEITYLLFIFLISAILVADLFLNSGRPATFDAPYHITNMAQFYQALKSGDFPVVWNDGVGNYGLPNGIIAHQLTSYIGAGIIALGFNPAVAYNIVLFTGILFSNIFFYIFLRFYFQSLASFAAVYLFNFTYYKIINIYIRGALPELFSAVFLAAILISLYLLVKKKLWYGFFLLAMSIMLLALTHPMMLLIYAFVFVPYTFFLLLEKRMKLSSGIKLLLRVFSSMLLGIGIAAYYLIPLNAEIKYMYYGLAKNYLNENTALGLINFTSPFFSYYTPQEIFTRGHLIRTGVFEAVSVIGAVGFLIWVMMTKKYFKIFSITGFAAFTILMITFLSSTKSSFLFQNISILSNIQFQWRFLSAFIFLPPILYASFFTKFNNKFLIAFFIISVTSLIFPQIYGKNYSKISQGEYYFTKYNLQGIMTNTIWSGKTEDYPVKRQKAEIIAGNGKILNSTVKNSSRQYKITAAASILMADFTFYFPGWSAYIDGKKTNIEYQDPQYRGIITYFVPKGQHIIDVKLEDTKVRFLGKLTSILSLALISLLFIFRKKFNILNI